MITNPREQWEYYIVPFPFIYKCENGRFELRIAGTSYCSQLQFAINNPRLQRGINPDTFYKNSIFAAICLESNFLSRQQSLMYLIDLEREGMPEERNKFVFPHKIIFENYHEAYSFSRDIQIAYSADCVIHALDIAAEIRRHETSQEILHIASEILGETLTDSAKDMLEDIATEFAKTGVISFDIFTPHKIVSVLIKSLMTVLFKKLVKR